MALSLSLYQLLCFPHSDKEKYFSNPPGTCSVLTSWSIHSVYGSNFDDEAQERMHKCQQADRLVTTVIPLQSVTAERWESRRTREIPETLSELRSSRAMAEWHLPVLFSRIRQSSSGTRQVPAEWFASCERFWEGRKKKRRLEQDFEQIFLKKELHFGNFERFFESALRHSKKESTDSTFQWKRKKPK